MALLCVAVTPAVGAGIRVAVLNTLNQQVTLNLNAAGFSASAIGIEAIDAGSLTTENFDVLVFGRLYFNPVNPATVNGVKAFLNAGGGLITEWDGNALLFSGYHSTYRYARSNPQAGFWQGQIGAGDLLATGRSISTVNTAHPIMANVPAVWNGGSATEFFFTAYGYSTTADFETLGTFEGNGTVKFPATVFPAIMVGKTKKIVALMFDWQDNPNAGAIPTLLVNSVNYLGLASGPAVASRDASSVGSSGATLNGTVNPNGAATNATFLYSTVSDLSGNATKTVDQPIGSGTGPVAVSQAIMGLRARTTYYFRSEGTNNAGSNSGAILHFTTGNTDPIAGTGTTSVTTGETVMVTLPFTTLDADGDTVTISGTPVVSDGAPFTLGAVVGNQIQVTGAAGAVGVGTIIFTVTDGFGGSADGWMDINVMDNDPPTISVPENTVVEAGETGGATVSFNWDAVDNIGIVSMESVPESGFLFPLGENTVTLTAKDQAGNSTSVTFTVTVVDSTPPVLTPHPDVNATATTVNGATVNYAPATATDLVTGSPIITYSQNSGTLFPIGRTKVIVCAKDGAGLTAKGSFIVTVKPGALDTIPPVVNITAPVISPVPGAFRIAGTVKDNYGLNSLTVKLNGQVLPLDSPLNAPLNFPRNTNVPWAVSAALPENGSNDLVVEAVDLNGLTTRVSKSITYWNRRPELAGNYNAILVPEGIPNINTSGLVTLSVLDTGAFSGKIMLGGTEIPLLGVLRNNGAAQFRGASSMVNELPLVKQWLSTVMVNGVLRLQTIVLRAGTLVLQVSRDEGLSGVLKEGPGDANLLGSFEGLKAPYSSTKLVPAQFLNVPGTGIPKSGYYTVVLGSVPASPDNGFHAIGGLPLGTLIPGTGLQPPSPQPPAGLGYASLTLTNTGIVTLTGYLADGASWVGSGQLRCDGTVAIFTSLYGNKGGIAGELAFESLSDSDVSADGILWIRTADATSPPYPRNWPNGFAFPAVGAKYAAPASLNFGQGSDNKGGGNSILSFDGVTHFVSIHPGTGAVTKVPAADADYQISFVPTTGIFSGTFKESGGIVAPYRGILLNKGSNLGGFGYFLSNDFQGEGRPVTLEPNLAHLLVP